MSAAHATGRPPGPAAGPGAAPAPRTGSSVLLLTADDALAGEVLRLAAAAGAAVDCCADPATAALRWSAAASVLVGWDQAAGASRGAPPRRDGVYVVGFGVASDHVLRSALELGATSVLELPQAEERVVGLLGDLVDDTGPGPGGVVVGVVAGSGGAGATVLASALALTAGRRGPAMLVDLDPLGPGLGRLVGLEGQGGITWHELEASRGRIGSRSLRDALPRLANVAVLGWPDEPSESPSSQLLREVVAAGRRGHDVVVLDIPRSASGRDDAVSRCDQVLLVVRAEVGPVASAARLARGLHEQGAGLGAVVRTRRGGLLADDVVRALGLPLWAEVRDQRRLAEHLDLGFGPVHRRRGSLARAAEHILGQLVP